MFEWSSLFLNGLFMSILVKEYDPRAAVIESVSSVLFAITFTVVRMLIGNYYYLEIINLAIDQWDALPAWVWCIFLSNVVASAILNTFWFIQIVQAALGYNNPTKKEKSD